MLDRLGRVAVRAALELVLAGGSACEQGPDRRELLGQRQVRGAGDRELLFLELRQGAGQRQRLDRLGRRAHERDERAVTRFGDDGAVLDRDGVHAVT